MTLSNSGLLAHLNDAKGDLVIDIFITVSNKSLIIK